MESAAAAREAAHEASFYERLPDQRVHCTLCPHQCRMADGTLGACGVRVNHHGVLYSLVADRIVASNTEPIEKKPLFHFLPGSRAYSVATVGCCLRCSFCQNWEISQWPRTHLPRRVQWADQGETGATCGLFRSLQRDIPGDRMTPEQIVDDAIISGARSIAYTFVEPTIFYELAYETAVIARERGLKNVFVTCGYTADGALERLCGVLDAANVDLKFFKDSSYRRISRGSLQPVLDAIRLYRDRGVWVEVTTLVIPGINDTDEELAGIAGFLRSVSEDLPWHVSRFFPAYQMQDRPPTPLATLQRARQIGLDAGLRYVYEGNAPGAAAEHTDCYRCGVRLIERSGFVIRSNTISQGRCPNCYAVIEGVELDQAVRPPGTRRGVRQPRRATGSA
ncbi:MAG: AmmeMemoRadiSam system radical SAM enzyme [Gemmatimonadetes bacterium]|nr:AmmeMemoRadiSam system radical SAM enzyme [Gemmatimonadota bacterium]